MEHWLTGLLLGVAIRIMRPVIDLEHVFHLRVSGRQFRLTKRGHRCHERGAGLGRNDELLSQVRFENVFFNVRPIVLSLALATMFNSTTLSSSRLNVHRS